MPPVTVTIIPDEASRGRTVFSEPLLQEGMQHDNSPDNWLRIEHEMIITVAARMRNADMRRDQIGGRRGTGEIAAAISMF